MSMLQAAIVILLVMGAGATAIVGAFFWAAKNRQFEDVENGSLVIFDADEPVGESTDSFPRAALGSKN
jgi:cbb3-type cytochrome oxidase maturation protein